MKISVIVPTYNEKDNIAHLTEQIFGVAEQKGLDLELLIVDDNSPDGTGKIAEGLAKRYPIKVIHRNGKQGLGSAVLAGFREAEGEVLGVMDADLSHPPEFIPALLGPLIEGRADMTVGSRYVGGGKIVGMPKWRVAISRGACLLASLLTPVRDPVSGFFFLKKEVIDGTELQTTGFKICLEILVKGKGQKIEEVPYTFVNRLEGKSKLSLGEIKKYLVQILDLRRFQRARRGR